MIMSWQQGVILENVHGLRMDGKKVLKSQVNQVGMYWKQNGQGGLENINEACTT